ncbi:mucosal addressin cell adhesion molecule 1-like isoform X2 [Branchiostoma lanceolatum]|uniref:mucosal addressin cell adhesion molecule 1-like isoform X2 n=1 Tax=Branchiostoma lanceolatum TaxID=7740 RepID=UPI003453A790
MDHETRKLFFFFLAAVSVQAGPLGQAAGDRHGGGLAQGAEVFYRPEIPDSGVPEKRWGGACLGCPPDPILISGRAFPESGSKVPENPQHGNPDSGRPEVPESPQPENPDSGRPEVPESPQPENPDSGRPEAPEKRWGGECLGCPPDPIILLGKRKRSE